LTKTIRTIGAGTVPTLILFFDGMAVQQYKEASPIVTQILPNCFSRSALVKTSAVGRPCGQ
jgi:hypothetical protein